MIWALLATLLRVGISMYLILSLLAALGGIDVLSLSDPSGDIDKLRTMGEA